MQLDRKFTNFLILAALTLLGGWLRFSAINFGLPDQFRPDEEKTVPKALDFEEDWNPHLAIYPAAQTYLMHGVLRTYATFNGADSNLREAYGADNGAQAFLIARQLSAAMGTATIPVIYLAAAPIYGSSVAMLSAATLALSFIHVRESKFAKVEVPAALWLALSILMILRIVVCRRWSDYVLAGLFCGLAAATHYTAGAIAIGIVVAHFERRYRETRSVAAFMIDPRIYVAGLVAMLAFLATDPYFVLDWPQTMHDYQHLSHDYVAWRTGLPSSRFGWRWLLFLAMPSGLGLELELFLVASTVWVLFRPRPGTYALFAFVIVCFVSMTGGHPQLEFRYLVNPLIAMSILGGIFAVDLAKLAESSRFGTNGRMVVAAAAVLLLIPSLIRDVQLNQLLRRDDTRTIARRWIFQHIPPGTPIALVGAYGYGKPNIDGPYALFPTDSLESLRAITKGVRWVIADSFPPLELWSRGPSEAELADLDSRGTLAFDIDSLKPGAVTPGFDPNDAFYAPFTRITNMTRPGPRIRIWTISASPAPIPAPSDKRQ